MLGHTHLAFGVATTMTMVPSPASPHPPVLEPCFNYYWRSRARPVLSGPSAGRVVALLFAAGLGSLLPISISQARC